MKWPLSITLVRHCQSKYNELRPLKDADERYRLFKKAFNRNPESSECYELAVEMSKKFSLDVGDYETPPTELGLRQSVLTGQRMSHVVPVPDVVIVSPYRRTRATFDGMAEGWPDLLIKPSVYYEDRIREQEHGLALLYSDWRIFQVFHPEQRKLYKLLGPYWYQHPQGESVAQVRDRVRSMTGTIMREWAGKHVMLVTHHLTILSIRANFERMTPERFIELDNSEKPRNCSVTMYRGNPDLGTRGKLELEFYNRCFWEEPS